MRLLPAVLSLPSSLLLLLTAQIEAQDAPAQRLPTAIRKMGLDSGEKFLHEYCAFSEYPEAPSPQAALAARAAALPAMPADGLLSAEEESLLAANASAAIAYRAPLAPHSEPRGRQYRGFMAGWDAFRRAADAVARLERRDFACPTGTADCSGIGYPYSCCQTGLTCVEIEDTGLGPVGCCPSGVSCSGSIECTGDQEGCPSDMGGGCCIDGYVCEGVGCVRSQSSGTVMTSTITSTTTLASGSPSLVIVTVTVTQSPSQSVATSTTTQVVTVSQTSSTTTGPGAPVRPTGTSSAATTSPASTSSATSSSSGYCPTGYYACLASAGGGCCQTGRDCSTTSCPAVSSTTIVSGDGVTVVVPATAVPSTSSATCAGGWFLCPSAAGPVAGCCPSGYSCGTASCTIVTASATATVQKELPGASGANKRVGGLALGAVLPWVVAFVVGLVWI
ncbi:GPI anchored protein [Pleurostoma richardsiae]|uniref:GPI anchored protein n=1 Tax=Pleurostoma richardsiae TaxID=41990 RepID=A0AA38RQW7_9PEZI|nr:GPI anchored protein [Pleurostoma richardsiae]